MGMPVLIGISEGDGITFENALNNILISIAMEESAIAHILNAEGEILQYMTGTGFQDTLPIEDGESCNHYIDAFTSVAGSMIGVVDSLATMECRLTRKLLVAGQGNSFGEDGKPIPIIIPESCGGAESEAAGRLRKKLGKEV